MNRIGVLADRLLSRIVPKTSAMAATCEYQPCTYQFCYCSGLRYYSKLCCKTETGASCCHACTYRGNYC
jgi:hypothetical protein